MVDMRYYLTAGRLYHTHVYVYYICIIIVIIFLVFFFYSVFFWVPFSCNWCTHFSAYINYYLSAIQSGCMCIVYNVQPTLAYRINGSTLQVKVRTHIILVPCASIIICNKKSERKCGVEFSVWWLGVGFFQKTRF